MKHDSFFLTFACLIIAGVLSSCSSTSTYDANVNSDSSWGGAAFGTAVGGFTSNSYGTMNSLYYGRRSGYYGYTSAYRARGAGRAAVRGRRR